MPKTRNTPSKQDIIEDLKISAMSKLKLDEEIKKLTARKEKIVKEIFAKAEKNFMLVEDSNTGNRETYLDLGEGRKILIQLNKGKSKVVPVDNAIPMLREKLGEKLDPYTYTEEFLHDGAIETMVKANLLDNEFLKELLTEKEGRTTRFIKEVKG